MTTTNKADEALTNRQGDPLRVLVVGASSGIGASTASALVEAGARVAGAARRADRIAKLDRVVPVACDVGNVDITTRAVEEGASALGGLDAVVYATGTTGLTPLDSTGPDEWNLIFTTNVFGAAMVTRAALPHLRADGSDGRAVFLSSDSAVKPYPGLVAYGASKAALSAFCLGLASEFGDLRVTEVVVGPTVDTEVGDHFDPDAFATWFTRWCDEGFVRYGYQVSADVASVIADTLRAERPGARVMAAAEPDPPS
jgi:NAD(P)-dependent dehydrogenase (short-subunit alcohol dehydrogenase family)